MGHVLTIADWLVFFGSLAFVMLVGLIAGRREKTSEDYFLAGRSIPWWGVAGSIFGSNVSANHMVGMMGVGFTVGFAQSHFELGAIAGLMLLAYGFLPVYRRMRLYTLSEYLSRRYNEPCRILYAIIMVLIMVGVQMAPAFYIGSRSLCVLLGGNFLEPAAAAQPGEERLQDGSNADGRLALAAAAEGDVAPAADPLTDDEIDVAAESSPIASQPVKPRVRWDYYVLFILIMAVLTSGYTIFGGLKAVVWTDFLQSLLLLGAGLMVAFLVFSQPEVGGWRGMMAYDDARPRDLQKMHLYLPTSHAELPWTGALTGLLALHFFYWGANQFIVQRALGARSDHDARLGIVAAGFFKLLIPFFSIGAGVAVAQLFALRYPGQGIDGDAVFAEIVRRLVSPLGFGLVGLVLAGLLGAILSSIDSMMNSAATIFSIDIYRRYIRPDASERALIWVGRFAIVAFVTIAVAMAIWVLDPNSEKNFFLTIADQQSHLIPGLLAAFFLGMFWRRANSAGAMAAIVSGIVVSVASDWIYRRYFGPLPDVAAVLGTQLNFLHRAAIALIGAAGVHVAVSLATPREPEKEQYTWTMQGGHDPQLIKSYLYQGFLVLLIYGLMTWMARMGLLYLGQAGFIAAAATAGIFLRGVFIDVVRQGRGEARPAWLRILADDRTWAGVLCGLAIWMMFVYA